MELLQLDKSGIRVAEYMTELPPRKTLEKKLHEAIRLARERLVARFTDLLPPGGHFLVGHSESLNSIAHDLEYVQPAVYRK